MSELKPCPFCGAEVQDDERGEKYPRKSPMGGWIIHCECCGASLSQFRKSGRGEISWNNRPIEDALQAENKQIKEDLQHEKTRSQLNLEAEERRMLNITYYCAEIDRLNARIADLEAAQRWIPVSERLPEEDTDGNTLMVICRHSGEWVRAPFGAEFADEFVRHYTHWMYAPQPPEVQE